MKRSALLTLGLLAAAGAAPSAQEPPAQTSVPVLQQDSPPPDMQRRRKQIHMLEGVFARAVRSGAEEIAKQMQRGNPNIVMFTGQARARGFLLDGYGVFFDVEIPALRESVVWSIRTLERDLTMATLIESLRRAFDAMPAGAERSQAEQALRRMQLMNPAPPLAAPQMPAQGGVVATTLAVPAIDDPYAAYTTSVQNALIDAMLDFSLTMDLRDDEWLTVAARDGEGPLTPGEIYEASTTVIRVKGSDLAMYAADKSKRDEVRQRVIVKVF